MKKQNTSGRPSPPMATPKLWYIATRCSPTQGWWIDATGHTARRSGPRGHTALCTGCVRGGVSHPHPTGCHGLLPSPHNRTDRCCLPGPCAGCPATYVGQMNRCLNQWLSEHRLAVESGEAATSTLAEHAWGAHHPVDWDKVRVLDHQPHHHQRLILESIHIRSQTRPLNRDTGSLPQIYNSLFCR